jgi:hypothetical protein
MSIRAYTTKKDCIHACMRTSMTVHNSDSCRPHNIVDRDDLSQSFTSCRSSTVQCFRNDELDKHAIHNHSHNHNHTHSHQMNFVNLRFSLSFSHFPRLLTKLLSIDPCTVICQCICPAKSGRQAFGRDVVCLQHGTQLFGCPTVQQTSLSKELAHDEEQRRKQERCH